MPENLLVRTLGNVPFESTWDEMKVFTSERDETSLDELWLLEHPAVYTLGQAGKEEHLINPGRIPVLKTDRGGQVTYHGPGQLVSYLLFDIKRMGISVRQPRDKQIKAVQDLTLRTLARIGAGSLPSGAIIVDDGYVGEGYGLPASSTLEAIDLAAKLEGLLLDPVYSGKGLAGLVGLCRENFFEPTDNVLFLHTGGSAALFAYEAAIFPEEEQLFGTDS